MALTGEAIEGDVLAEQPHRHTQAKRIALLNQLREVVTKLSDQAIDRAESALLKLISEMDRLSETANADQLVAKLLREFDIVTGLSGWSEPSQVN